MDVEAKLGGTFQSKKVVVVVEIPKRLKSHAAALS